MVQFHFQYIFVGRFDCIQCTVLTFCLPANVHIVFICIIAGAVSMLPTQGCVHDICPRECIKTKCPWAVFPCVLVNMATVVHIFWYRPCCHCQWIPRNTRCVKFIKNYIPIEGWTLTVLESIRPWKGWEIAPYLLGCRCVIVICYCHSPLFIIKTTPPIKVKKLTNYIRWESLWYWQPLLPWQWHRQRQEQTLKKKVFIY